MALLTVCVEYPERNIRSDEKTIQGLHDTSEDGRSMYWSWETGRRMFGWRYPIQSRRGYSRAS
ncbi:hypothetical protein IG631_08272 [Alternaria alternata]|nr:hypothetical protein IG631_08272 [Alternaria alternata]